MSGRRSRHTFRWHPDRPYDAPFGAVPVEPGQLSLSTRIGPTMLTNSGPTRVQAVLRRVRDLVVRSR